jgi:hypothetical protein
MRASLKLLALTSIVGRFHAGKILKTCATWALLVGLSHSASAQILVGSGGVGPITFAAEPPLAITEWATINILTGAANSYINPDQVDAGVQTLDATTITLALNRTNAVNTSRIAAHHTNNTYIYTQPTGVPMAVIKSTLRNNSGSAVNAITVSYNYSIVTTPVTDEAPGQRVFYSLTGAVGSWVLIPEFSGKTATALLTAGITFASPWGAGADMFILWADDNNLTGADGGFAIDNFTVALGLPPCPGITNQPRSITVTQCVTTSVSFSIGTTGAVVGIQWFRNSGTGFTNIPGATANTYTLNAIGTGDSTSQFRAEVTGGVGCSTVTSSAATLTVAADTTPPTLLFGYVNTNLTNLVLFFSERISTNCGACAELYANVILVDTNTGNQVATLAGQTYFSGSRVAAIYTDGTPLDITHGYNITLSLVEDECAGNVLPDTTYPIGHLVEHVIGLDGDWKYDINNGDRFGTGWEATAYNDSAWPSGPSGLGHDVSVNGVPIRTELNYMSNGVPAFFRRHFTLPGSGTQYGGLVINSVMEDGAVYYINGQEVLRQNVNPGVLSAATLTIGNQTDPTPIQGPFFAPSTGLVTGDNVIAVAVLQSAVASSDLEMALDLSIVLTQPSPAGPTLHISANGSVSTITWTGGGTLQRSSNISSPANWVNIPGASSPFVTNAPPAIQFFRVTVP